MEPPLVSVVLATYNREKLVGKAIRSVLDQTFSDWELVIVNDKSTDNTSSVILNYVKKDPRILILENEVNLGQVKSLNKGIKNSRGKYIARVDDDDAWCDKMKLEKQANFLETHPDYVLTGGGVIVINEKEKELIKFLHPQADNDIRKRMLFHTQFAHGAVMFRRSAFDSVGGYDEGLGYCEDWDLWLKLGKAGRLYNFPEYFLCYLKSDQRKTADWRNETKYDSKLREKYRNDYPNYRQAVLFGFISNIYYSIPFVRGILYPLSASLRSLFFKTSTLSFKKNKKIIL